ncbi:MAG: hypothetical protein PHU27_08425, partial [Salinivirgaceae bacterium]|nr:hypothetical protein [Salinivirgaceae bacterium]
AHYIHQQRVSYLYSFQWVKIQILSHFDPLFPTFSHIVDKFNVLLFKSLMTNEASVKDKTLLRD